MKVKMKPNPGKPAQRKTGIVYCSHNGGELITARRYVYPKLSEQNSKTGSITANLMRLNPSEGYKQDLREYIRLYNATPAGEEKPIRAWNNLYLRIMYAMAKADPTIDLRTLTREDIYTRDLPCISINRAVKEGLIVKVKKWEFLVAEV